MPQTQAFIDNKRTTTLTDRQATPASQGASDAYHRWYYDSEVWLGVEFMGVPCYKSVADMWNYQEIIASQKPAMIVEFGTRFGGAALYFSVIGRAVNPGIRVVSVDISHHDVYPQVLADPTIQLITSSSTDPGVAVNLASLRKVFDGPVFFILDSDHRKHHVLAEMELLRGITRPGDYLVVEDGNINGNPVLPGWGEGPFEAIAEYRAKYPGDYHHDAEREAKFGFTFAPNGFLIRR
jgi:cephalosporin hydroxylase